MAPGIVRNKRYQEMQSSKFETLGEEESNDLREVDCQLNEIHNQLDELLVAGVEKNTIYHVQSEIQAVYNSFLEGLRANRSVHGERSDLCHLQKSLILMKLESEIGQLNDEIYLKATDGQDIAGDRAQLNDLQSQLREIVEDLS
mmetsp:Transcript_20244/g.29812  ORF Transcript_20244/g.29812 Transcript_20244/m.29812 type:complete len:144 (-) Transcript_20244:1422-1853(-)